MRDSYTTDLPWRRFRDFIDLKADRFTVLKELLAEAGLGYSVLELSGNRHFVIAPEPPEDQYLRRPPVILVAHYDRAEGSPGANDNSAGVFILFETAVKLKKANEWNWLVVFTDGEELRPGESVQNQGSYSLAAGLKTVKMENSRIFCFDACGTGDTLVISTTLEYLLAREKNGEKLRETIAELRGFASGAARDLGMAKVLHAPTPFSDDAGFFMAGLAAQTVTMLPSAECVRLVSCLRKNPEYAETLIKTEMGQNKQTAQIPETWRYLNTPADSYLRLTPANFRTVVRFAAALCGR